ncbi:unnamed protein product, partial [marine sediment metagenome]
FAAFFMALWATMSLDRKAGAAKPSLAEVWWRFPKFIVGFVVASLIVFIVLEPIMGEKAAQAVGKAAKGFRDPFFATTFCPTHKAGAPARVGGAATSPPSLGYGGSY